jgi:hypothetical protein
MLFSDVADWYHRPIAVYDTHAEDTFGQENALGMVTECPVSEIRQERFRLVEPVVNDKIVFGLAAELSDAAPSVLEWMGHG